MATCQTTSKSAKCSFKLQEEEAFKRSWDHYLGTHHHHNHNSVPQLNPHHHQTQLYPQKPIDSQQSAKKKGRPNKTNLRSTYCPQWYHDNCQVPGIDLLHELKTTKLQLQIPYNHDLLKNNEIHSTMTENEAREDQILNMDISMFSQPPSPTSLILLILPRHSSTRAPPSLCI